MATDDVPQRVIYAKEIVGLGTQFGPYPGKDAKERKYSEWMAFVCKAKTRNEANLISFVSDNQKYFRSCKIIQPFDTFIVWDEETAENEGSTDSNAQRDLHENQDVNGVAPQRMKLRAKKSTTDVAKADSTKPVKNAKEMKMNSISIDANASSTDKIPGKSGHITDNFIGLDWIKPVTCTDCSEGFVSHAGLAFHRLLHGQDRQCITCGNKFTIHENLQQHLLSHSSEKFTTCDQCFRFFDKEFDLTTASKLYPPNSYKRFKPPLCNECESYIIINRDITIAKQISGELICNYCGRVYFSRKSLNIHLDKHNSKYCCRKCGKVFGTYSAITRHVVVHTNFKPFKCEMCGKMFANVLKQQHHATLCGKRNKRREKVLPNTPVNGSTTVENEKSANPSSTLVSNSLPNKVHNTRSLSRSKPGSPTIGNEKTDALDCSLVDDDSSLSSPPLGGAEFFHCQLENNNIFSNGNINFPFASEQASASQQRLEELKFHRSSSRCNEDVAAQKTPNLLTPNDANHFDLSSACRINNFTLPIDDAPDSPQSTDVKIKSEPEPWLKLNGISFHDCSVKITSLYDCPRCPKVYASSEGLTMHSLTHFYAKTCQNCGNEFTLHRRMKKHLLGHSAEDIKDCFKCEKLFGVPFSYDQIDACDNAGCLLCDDCDKVARVETSEKDSLLESKQIGQIETLENKKIFRDHLMTRVNDFLCSECGLRFPSCEKLDEHLCAHETGQIQNVDANANVKDDLNEKQTSCASMQNVFRTDHTYSSGKNDKSQALVVSSCGMASKAPHKNGEATFYFKCFDCKRNFLTEAATSLHMLLHIGQLCNLCGDHIQHDFELITNNVPLNGSLCTRCNRI